MDLKLSRGEGWRKLNENSAADPGDVGVVAVPSTKGGVFVATWPNGDQKMLHEIALPYATADQMRRVEGDVTFL